MDNQLAVREESYLSKLIIKGDLSALSEQEILSYHKLLCNKIGIPEVLRPFNIMTTKQGKFFYANKTFTDWARAKHEISFIESNREFVEGVVITNVRAETKEGRRTFGVGAMPTHTLAQTQSGEYVLIPLPLADKANAIKVSDTQAKRRATLELGGYGFLDESEIISVAGAVVNEEPLMIDTDKPEKALVAKYVMLHKKARSEGKDIPFLPIEQSTKADFIAAIESLGNS